MAHTRLEGLSERKRVFGSGREGSPLGLLALLRKCPEINGAGEGNRTLVIIHGTQASLNGCNPVAWDTFRSDAE